MSDLTESEQAELAKLRQEIKERRKRVQAILSRARMRRLRAPQKRQN